MSLYEEIESKIAAGDIVILDGGTGTDVQRRGAPMSADTWSAEANLTHPHIVRAVHEDYVEAGADLIIANTFATSPLLFNHLGRDEDVAERLDHEPEDRGAEHQRPASRGRRVPRVVRVRRDVHEAMRLRLRVPARPRPRPCRRARAPRCCRLP